MSTPQPNECTSLSVGEGRYRATKPTPPAADRPAGICDALHLPRLGIACGAIFSLVFLVSMLLSEPGGAPNAEHGGTPGGSPGNENLQDASAGVPVVEDRTVPSMQPFSTMDPADVHCPHMDRPRDTWPSGAWGTLANASVDLHTSLPTNAWWENIALGSPTQETRANNVVVLPYTFDVTGDTPGLRIHFPQVLATDLIVRTAFDWRHALQLGCVESVSPHYITQPGPLSVTLNWKLDGAANSSSSSPSQEALLAGEGSAPAMSVPAVRGSPYATMEYRGVRPVISARQEVTQLIVDGERLSPSAGCANGTAVRVEREAEVVFSGGAVSSDDTWLVFTSSPMDFLCSSWFAMERGDPPTPGAVGAWQSMPRFRLEAVEPVAFGVVRTALVNGCSSGRGGSRCEKRGVADDKSRYAELLREHAEVYPTGEARVAYSSSTLDWIQDALQQGDDNAQAAAATATAAGADGSSADAATAAVAAPAASRVDAAARGAGADPTRTVGASSSTARTSPSSSSSSSNDATGSGRGSGSGSGGPNEEGTLRFLWAPRRMDGQPIAPGTSESGGEVGGGEGGVPLIMFALLHHKQTFSSTDLLTGVGTPTLHGQADVVIGDEWNLKVDLPPVSFGVGRPVREEMVADINDALDEDVGYEIPANYLRGEGDTYFSGKMLAKMGRIALIAEEMGRHDDARMVAARLAEASQVWLNGTAGSPFLYDFRWGGVVSCGCAYRKGQGCTNGIGPHQCPALSDPGMNFGQGFYNDHHFHYGYHIFAAAIAAKFLPEWGMQHHEAVTLLIRDIANPSSSDPFFPVFRHKDWYLGSSWALGIPTLGGVPYMNGRNQESSSEAVNAYYAVALYGHVMAQVFTTAGEPAKAQTASLVRDTGRQLLATEVHSAQIYWQVANVDTPGMPRVYPEAYKPHVVGMLWSTLAQMQTWFGAEAWKVYGIQMLPITAVSEQLLAPRWVQQMLPSFEDSCLYDSNPVKACIDEGWSMLVHAGQAITGRWEDGRDGILALPDDAFETAGGNGHSRTSMLWFVANRPPAPPATHDATSSGGS